MCTFLASCKFGLSRIPISMLPKTLLFMHRRKQSNRRRCQNICQYGIGPRNEPDIYACRISDAFGIFCFAEILRKQTNKTVLCRMLFAAGSIDQIYRRYFRATLSAWNGGKTQITKLVSVNVWQPMWLFVKNNVLTRSSFPSQSQMTMREESAKATFISLRVFFRISTC